MTDDHPISDGFGREIHNMLLSALSSQRWDFTWILGVIGYRKGDDHFYEAGIPAPITILSKTGPAWTDKDTALAERLESGDFSLEDLEYAKAKNSANISHKLYLLQIIVEWLLKGDVPVDGIVEGLASTFRAHGIEAHAVRIAADDCEGCNDCAEGEEVKN